MSKCIVCSKDYEAKRSSSKYCGGKCRKLAFQGNGKVSVLGEKEVSVPATIIDACGKEHPIDFEGRRKDVAKLESWSKGEGVELCLHLMHSRINGFRDKDNNLTPQGHRYLGQATASA